VPLARGCPLHPPSALAIRRDRSFSRSLIALALCLALAAPPSTSASPAGIATVLSNEAAEPAKIDCALNSARGDVQHVIYIQFSHLGFTRDNPDVPSDLERMPHLLHFMESNGTLLTNHHTVLPSEAESDALTSLTGLYADRLGSTFASNSRYWTTPPEPNSATPNGKTKIADENKFAPAPWVPFTRAGCNVGVVGTARMALENTGKDILNVFGPNSLEAALAADPSTITQAAAELEGIAIHCAFANPVCSFGVPDLLPDEPRGYQGFAALFGHKNVAPIISPAAPLVDLNGKPIADAKGTPGFPGLAAISVSQSLAYVAAMQEHGVPVTFAYVSDSHRAPAGSLELSPGEAGYVTQLQANDEAFEKFLARLAADGINQNNTLFVVTSGADEHFTSGALVPTTCDAINAPCSYARPGEALWTHEASALDTNTTTFLAFAGPGVSIKGVETNIWSDHADTRPTLLALLGLKDDYVSQGRVLAEVFQVWALPNGLRDSPDEFLQLAQAYKRVSAPVGELALTTQRVSTAAQAADGAKRNNLQSQLVVIAALRNDLSAAMADLLNAAAFYGRHISEPETRQLVRSANDLLEYVKLLAANGW
jgi:hypothetical protein